MTNIVQRSVDRLHRHRLWVLVLVHAALIVAANQAAFWLRFDGEVPAAQQPNDTSLLPWLIAVRLAVFLPLRLHRGLWRYASISDLRDILVGVAVSTVLFWGITHGLLGVTTYPRSVFLIDAVLLVCLMGGARLGRRLYRGSGGRDGQRRVLVYGAGNAGELIVRDMLTRTTGEYAPIGFIDDDASKRGCRIHGVPVLGTGEDLARVVRETRPAEILVAIPRADAASIRAILTRISDFAVVPYG